MTQMLDTSGAAWEQIKQQVAATYARVLRDGHRRPGPSGTTCRCWTSRPPTSTAAIQKLNQGWDTQTSAMTGAMTAFDSVAQGFGTLSRTAMFTENWVPDGKNIPEAKARDRLADAVAALP